MSLDIRAALDGSWDLILYGTTFSNLILKAPRNDVATWFYQSRVNTAACTVLHDTWLIQTRHLNGRDLA